MVAEAFQSFRDLTDFLIGSHFYCLMAAWRYFRNESNGKFVLGVVFFLQTNFDILTSHF